MSPEFEQFVRWIKGHRDSVKVMNEVLDAGDARTILTTVPEFLDAVESEVMRKLESYEQERRGKLGSVTDCMCTIMAKLEALYHSASIRAKKLRRSSTLISVMVDELSLKGREKEANAKKLLGKLKQFEDTRTTLLRRLKNPSWEVPHHFHMTALEHFRGHRQPHLFDIAEALPDQMRVCAIARHSRVKNTNVFKKFQGVREERDNLFARLREAEKHRDDEYKQLRETQRLLDTMKENMLRKALTLSLSLSLCVCVCVSVSLSLSPPIPIIEDFFFPFIFLISGHAPTSGQSFSTSS